jgi:hypothetical protein
MLSTSAGIHHLIRRFRHFACFGMLSTSCSGRNDMIEISINITKKAADLSSCGPNKKPQDADHLRFYNNNYNAESGGRFYDRSPPPVDLLKYVYHHHIIRIFNVSLYRNNKINPADFVKRENGFFILLMLFYMVFRILSDGYCQNIVKYSTPS